jgi:hypothetical protein
VARACTQTTGMTQVDRALLASTSMDIEKGAPLGPGAVAAGIISSGAVRPAMRQPNLGSFPSLAPIRRWTPERSTPTSGALSPSSTESLSGNLLDLSRAQHQFRRALLRQLRCGFCHAHRRLRSDLAR